MGSVNNKVNRDFIREYYKKRIEFNNLRRELDKMSNEIKEYLANEGVGHKTVGAYTLNIIIVNKTNKKFIELLKEINRTDLIQENCFMEDFRTVCDELNIEDKDKEQYLDLWYKQLTVRKIENM